jgi:DNA-binding NarL/FixJ family response regulator
MRVLLVDDHAVVRRGMRTILEDSVGGVVIVEAANGDDALAAIEQQELDVVVLDLSMPGRSGLDLLAELKHRKPKLPVLIMSLHDEQHFAIRTLRAGASGYLMKDAVVTELVTAVTRVARGGRYVSDAIAERLAADAGKPTSVPHERLSDREFDVMRGIASGSSVSEIAAQLHLSVKTVSTYRTRLLEKMGMASNAELTRYALDHGLV